jgi:hypothetical protein
MPRPPGARLTSPFSGNQTPRVPHVERPPEAAGSLARVRYLSAVGRRQSWSVCITGLNDPNGVAVDSKFIYWAQGGEVGLPRVSAITARWVGCASSWASRPASVTQAKIPRRS